MPEKEEFNWVYILQMKNGKFYTGYTADIKKRYASHLKGAKSAAKTTRNFKVDKLLACWKVWGTRGNALRVEAFIKKKTRLQKEDLLKNPASLKKDFNQSMNASFKINFSKVNIL